MTYAPREMIPGNAGRGTYLSHPAGICAGQINTEADRFVSRGGNGGATATFSVACVCGALAAALPYVECRGRVAEHRRCRKKALELLDKCRDPVPQVPTAPGRPCRWGVTSLGGA
jgi:hypothetical protein